MSWETVIPAGSSLSPLQLVGLVGAVLGGIALVVAAFSRRRAETARDHQASPSGDDEMRADRYEEMEPAHYEEMDPTRRDAMSPNGHDDAPAYDREPDLEGLKDDNYLKRVFSSHSSGPQQHDIPAFTSLSGAAPSDRVAVDRSQALDAASKRASAGDVSSLLFRLLGTKARILELERAEKTKSRVLASTREALESLKGSLEGSSSELHEELDEMHELISGELSASHQSADSVQQLKEIIEAQYELLNRPDAVFSAELLLAKQSYVESIDASLDRRLKNAERREIEFALGKDRIMALKKQMLKLRDAEVDTTRAH